MPDQRGHHATLTELAAAFRHFADRRCGSYAPLYRRLGATIAANPALLEIAGTATAGQSPPDLMLAAVHYLIARESAHPLARYYPTLTTQPIAGDPAQAFRDFCLERHDELTALISTRLVQTNEVRRCCYLLPAVMLAARLAGRPIALIEPGASAGLNLAMDDYSYDYDSRMVTGGADSCLILQCRLQGSNSPPLDQPIPQVSWRAGIDRHPLDPASQDDADWLRALVWADHPGRANRLATALAAVRRPAPVYAGDAVDVLPALAEAVPQDLAICLFHTAFLAHLPAHDRQRFEHQVPVLSEERPIYWIQAEPRRNPVEPRLRLTTCQDGRITGHWPLGNYHPHGEWLEWTASIMPTE